MNSPATHWAIIIGFLLLVAGGVYAIATRQAMPPGSSAGYEECVEAGGIVTLSYPAQCRLPDGRTFFQEIPPEDQPRVPLLPTPTGTIDSYEECVAAGYPTTLSYPATCRIPGGQVFSQSLD